MYVCVTLTWKGDVGVVPLCRHNCLNTVSDQVSGLQAVAHAICAHGNAVRHANGVEAVAHHARLLHTVLDLLRQLHEVHVAGVALVPDGRDAHLRFAHILRLEARSVQHGLTGSLGLGLRDPAAVLVQSCV